VNAITKADWEAQRRASLDAVPQMALSGKLPEVLLPYQGLTVGLLDSTAVNRVIIIEKSRRIGLTWGLAAACVLRAGRMKVAGGMDAMYISYSQEMTREFIDACAMWARNFNFAAAEAEDFLFDDSDKDGDRSIQAFRIRFASGFEIIALSSAPRSLRGKQGLVVIDEAAFVDSLAELMKAALAFLMWGGQVVVCSTHNGTDNYFNELVQDCLSDRKPYKLVHIDFDAALKDGLYQRICLVTGKDWSPEAEADWRQEIIDFYGDGADEELFCIPAQGSGAWLTAPLIEARMTVKRKVLRLELPADYLHLPRVEQMGLMDPFLAELRAALDALDLQHRYAFGFDFARVADLSVGSLVALTTLLRRVEELTFELRNVPGDEQKLITKTVLDHVRERLVGAAFDATGMGWTVAEDMGRLFGLREGDEGSGVVMAVKFSEEWYRVNMPPLKAAFEDDTLALIVDDEHLTDLRSVKVVRGIPRVPVLREGTKGKRRHGDFAIALALAHYASRMQWAEYAYTPVVSAKARPSGRLSDLPNHDDDAASGQFGGGLRRSDFGGYV